MDARKNKHWEMLGTIQKEKKVKKKKREDEGGESHL